MQELKGIVATLDRHDKKLESILFIQIQQGKDIAQVVSAVRGPMKTARLGGN